VKALSLFVVVISTLSMVLGVAFICLGVWGLFSPVGNSILHMEPNWGTNDYASWGLVLTIVGYLGLLRARTEADTGVKNG
jgi:hypothetical protein